MRRLRSGGLIASLILLASILSSCNNVQGGAGRAPAMAVAETASVLPTYTPFSTATPDQLSPTPALSGYAFPEQIDPSKRYLIYVHGKIIEDQGLPAISPDYGEYEYDAILKKLSSYGFVVISDQRPKDADVLVYAKKITQQAQKLLDAGVPAKNITVVGASKGGAIAIYVSHLLANPEVSYVIMAICHPDNVTDFIRYQVTLYGNVLSIYDSSDELAGSCQSLFDFSQGKGLARHEEIVLQVGTGHGILYKPLDEWITPIIQWAGNPQ
jgi:predicted small secreted protein